jgi:hypothetical protein
MAKTIPIAEDQQRLRESIAELLVGEGHEVPQAGLTAVRQRKCLPVSWSAVESPNRREC